MDLSNRFVACVALYCELSIKVLSDQYLGLLLTRASLLWEYHPTIPKNRRSCLLVLGTEY